MVESFNKWLAQKPAKGGHPLGHAKLVMVATLLDVIIKTPVSQETMGTDIVTQHTGLVALAKAFPTLHALVGDVSHCSCRLTKKEDKYLLKMQWSMGAGFRPFYKTVEYLLVNYYKAEKLVGAAPKGSLVRDIENNIPDRCRSGGA